MNFAYTAMNAAGEQISEVLDCTDEAEARKALAERGLFVLKLAPGGGAAPRSTRGKSSFTFSWPHNYGHDLMVFARQMSMMLRSGAPMVPAIRAIIEQPARPEWRRVLISLADDVEGGATLNEAMGQHPKYFSGMVRGAVAAGEATAGLCDSFQRLSEMLESAHKTRKTILAALIYPALLCMMSVGVVLSMTLFVLPRFADLFEMLDTELPFITRLMLDTSARMKQSWIIVLLVPSIVVFATVTWLRSAVGRKTVGRLILYVPAVGPAVSGVLLAKLLRIWGALLRSNVPLLDAIKQTRKISGNVTFQKLNADVIEAVTAGRELHGVLRASRFVPPTVAAAIATGEQSGKLGESLEFVATWLEEENESRIGTLTRMFEPLVLVLLGIAVGGVSIALFLPLFEIATAA